MNYFFLPYFLTSICLYLVGSPFTYAQPIWNFSVEVAVERQTAEYYQRVTAKELNNLVAEQIAAVNANFNTARSPSRFIGTFNFFVDTLYVIDGNAQNEIGRPHPKRAYKLVINGFAPESSGGGWYGAYKTIYHNWKWDFYDGPFAQTATDGLTHEFGHARGAIDLYALKVDADKNPINHSAFQPVQSIMDYPYGNIVWDAYTVNILNSTGAALVSGESYITDAFPPVGIKAIDSQGTPIEGASIELYPVEWFSYAVGAAPVAKSATTSRGLFLLPTNPFLPGATDYPWHIRYCNFLVKASYETATAYAWMPLYDVQNTYFKTGRNDTHLLTIPIPTTVAPMTTVAPITIKGSSPSIACVGGVVSATCATAPIFTFTNTFTLQLSDVDGTFNHPTNLGTLTGAGVGWFVARIPDTLPGSDLYRIRVVSSEPYTESASVPFSIRSLPAAPDIALPVISSCQGTSAQPLMATGQNIRWYTSAVGGLGAETLRPPTDVAGSTFYYAAQTINGCEGPRSRVEVLIKSKPAPPLIANQTICQQFCRTASSCDYLLSGTPAQGATIQWYNEAGSQYAQLTGRFASNYTLVFVNEAGWRIGANTLSANQVLNGCESDKTSFTLTLNQNLEFGPGNGGGTSFAVCQNSGTYTLAQFAGPPPANFQNYYYDPKTGVGSTTAPVISTSAVATYSFDAGYLSDKGCLSPKRTNGVIYAIVKPSPPAPGVTNIDLCQFANAQPLTATGEGLTWYDTEGKSIGSHGPTPATDQGATYAYQVSQTVDGCTGPRATLMVTVMSTPPPALAKPVLELCKGSSALPLEAVGTGLKWTDPTGLTSTAAPVPNTTKATEPVNGDAYYVTQTGTNGCESPKATIRVFVQGPPTLTLSAPPAVNLGMEVPISLLFTGTGPYQYKLLMGTSQPLSGSAVKDTIILVLPTRTTTYQVAEISNRCGAGLPVSTATVVVLVPTIQTQPLVSGTACAGSMLTASYVTTGQFNPGSAFLLQLARTESDTTKLQYTTLSAGQLTGGQISAMIPATVTAGTYLVRVLATNPKIPIAGTPSATTLTVKALPTALLTANQTTIYEGETVKLSVAFTGDGPWTFSYRDSSSVGSTANDVLTPTNPHVLEFKPPKSTVYRLTALANGCGASLGLPAPLLVTVNPALAVEPLTDPVRVYPIPTLSTVTIQFDPLVMPGLVTLTLRSEKGVIIQKQDTCQLMNQLNLSDQPAGIYILQIQIGTLVVNRKLIKY